ncbi:ribonuclease H [Senna tora]|uniref:Ribonuclease H n=1 Tax=Senna tora TaxID=362788 RepID=A0A834XHR0_9FABA|nr:ribonuclease H [Senna tora]
MNKAFLYKLLWQLMSKQSNLWVKVLAGKYKVSLRLLHSIESKESDSKLWKELCRLWLDFYNNIKWKIGNGSKIRMWKDNWVLENGSILQVEPGIAGNENINAFAKDFVNNQGDWDMSKINGLVSEDTSARIEKMVPPKAFLGPDQALWSPEKEGFFSVASAYKVVKKLEEPKENNHWSAIWSCKIQQRQRFLLWRLSHNRLPTRSRVASWSATSPLCSWCNNNRETNMHAIRDCPCVARVWKAFLNPKDRAWFFNLPTNEWIRWNLSRKKEFCNTPWPNLFAVACDSFWQWRNNKERDQALNVPSEGHRFILQVAKTNAQVFFSREPAISRQKAGNMVWTKPDGDWIKLNTDGVVCRVNGKAGCGGILRNSKGEWIQESDSKGALSQVSDSLQDDTNHNPILPNIKELLKRDWVVKVEFSPRLCNGCADMLAKSSLDFRNRLCILSSPPSSLVPLIGLDASRPGPFESGG